MSKNGFLTLLILIGLVGGAILGEFLHRYADDSVATGAAWMSVGKIILVRPLMLLVLPLVFLSVIVGTTSIGDPSRLGLVGGSTLLYYFSTMLLAVILGAILVTTINPGKGLSQETVSALQSDGAAEYQNDEDLSSAASDAKKKGLSGAWMKILEQVIPNNVFAELANGRTLGVIVFALLLGLALAACGTVGEPAIRFFHSLFSGVMRLVLWILWLTKNWKGKFIRFR